MWVSQLITLKKSLQRTRERPYLPTPEFLCHTAHWKALSRQLKNTEQNGKIKLNQYSVEMSLQMNIIGKEAAFLLRAHNNFYVQAALFL